MTAVFDRLQAFIEKENTGKPALRVLEAGCGSISYFHFQQEVHLVGIDISESQLERNTYLDERVLGDIQYYSFPPSSFDVIVCVDVLEHLPKPELALHKFNNAVKPNGLIVLKLPNVLSVKGLAAKFLPYRMHLLAYKYLNKGKYSAGDSDIVPFKTYSRFSITPNALKKSAREIGLTTVYFDTYDILGTDCLKQKKHTHRAYRMIKGFFKFASFNCLDHSEYILVLKKTC